MTKTTHLKVSGKQQTEECKTIPNLTFNMDETLDLYTNYQRKSQHGDHNSSDDLRQKINKYNETKHYHSDHS